MEFPEDLNIGPTMFVSKSIVKKLLKNKNKKDNKNIPAFNTVTYHDIMAKAEL